MRFFVANAKENEQEATNIFHNIMKESVKGNTKPEQKGSQKATSNRRRQIISVILLTLIGLILITIGYNMVTQKRILFSIGIFCIVIGVGIFVFLFGLLRK